MSDKLASLAKAKEFVQKALSCPLQLAAVPEEGNLTHEDIAKNIKALLLPMGAGRFCLLWQYQRSDGTVSARRYYLTRRYEEENHLKSSVVLLQEHRRRTSRSFCRVALFQRQICRSIAREGPEAVWQSLVVSVIRVKDYCIAPNSAHYGVFENPTI